MHFLKRSRYCESNASSPMPRNYSMRIHHPARHNGDNYHRVSLTPSILASRNRNNNNNKPVPNGFDDKITRPHAEDKKNANLDSLENLMKKDEEGDLHKKLTEAKIQSSMMQDRIHKITPKTPTRTPPGEPEIINTWEMMEGLDDISPFRSPTDITGSPPQTPFVELRFQEDEPVLESASTKPFWLQIEEDADNSSPDGNCKVLEFDPEIISSFKISLQELPLDHLFHIPLLENEKHTPLVNNVIKEIQSKVVVYFTTLRVVRKTYEDCCHVRLILKGLGFGVDERDVSMDLKFRDELKELLGEQCSLGGISLPKVFLGGNYLGGVEEIRKLHEDGQLEKVLEGCAMLEDCSVKGCACEACGDVRFLLCDTCSGSSKVYYEFDQEESEIGFQRCTECNENGLKRCPICCN